MFQQDCDLKISLAVTFMVSIMPHYIVNHETHFRRNVKWWCRFERYGIHFISYCQFVNNEIFRYNSFTNFTEISHTCFVTGSLLRQEYLHIVYS
jgi:hypothetical protein